MEIIQKIKSLKREEAFEALSLLNHQLTDGLSNEVKSSNLSALLNNPYENVEKVEELCKIILICAYLNEEHKDIVTTILESIGQRNFILGGQEIIAIAVLGLLALKLICTGGKKSFKEEIIVDTEKRIIKSKKTEIEYSTFSEEIGSVVKDVTGFFRQD